MRRFAIASLFAASTALAQLTVSDPVPLAPGPLGPAPRAVASPVAAQSASSYLLAWNELGTLRLRRFTLSGEPLDALPLLPNLDMTPWSAASDGDGFVIVAVAYGGHLYAIHVDRDGQADAPVPLPAVGLGASIVSNGRDYIVIMTPYFGGRPQPPIVVRLDRDGHLLSQVTAPDAWPYSAQPLAMSGAYFVVWLDFQNAVHAARIDDGANLVDDVVLERFVTPTYIAATARPGELAVASGGDDGVRLSSFDADLKSKDSIKIDATPRTIPSQIAWDGAGYVLNLQSLVAPYPHRLLSFRGTTTRELPMPANADSVVLVGGLRYWTDTRHPVPQLFAIAGDGAETLVSLSDTEQRLPRLIAFGACVAAVWAERTADGDVIRAALLDTAGRVVTGPVQIAAPPYPVTTLEAATGGDRIFVIWSGGRYDGHARLLDRTLSTVTAWDHLTTPRGVVRDGDSYLVFGQEYDGTSVERFGPSGVDRLTLPLASSPDEIRAAGDALVEQQNVYCSECFGIWNITLARITAGFPPMVLSSRNFSVQSPLAASVRTPAGVLLFLESTTELRAADDFRLLAKNRAAPRHLGYPLAPGDAAFLGERVIAAVGDNVEIVSAEGEQLGTFALGAHVTNARIVTSPRLMLVYDAPTATGSRRLFLRIIDDAPPRRRSAGR